MKPITKDNKKEILGNTFFLDDIILIAKLNYIDGIDYFNNILKNTSAKEIGAVIHVYKRKKGIEIRLTKLFKYFSVGISFDEIKEVELVSENDLLFFLIKTKSDRTITFTLKNDDKKAVLGFFINKLKIQVNEISKNVNLNIDEKLLEIRSFKYRRMGNIEFIYIYLFLYVFIGAILVLFTTIFNNPLLLYLFYPVFIVVSILTKVYRLRDLNKPIIEILVVFLPLINLYYLGMFLTKKGQIYNKLGKEILI